MVRIYLKNAKFCSKCSKNLFKSENNKLSSNMIVAILILVAIIAIVGLFASGPRR